MKISAQVKSSPKTFQAIVNTNDISKKMDIAQKPNGGAAINGGELLSLALATCFCNDLYREAKKRNIELYKVEVEASAEYKQEGHAGDNFCYRVTVEGNASDEDLNDLIEHTDKVAEIHNTLRVGRSITRIKS